MTVHLRWTVMEHPLRCRLDTTSATAGAAVLHNGPPATELGPIIMIGARAVSGPRNVTDRRPGILRDPGPVRERAADSDDIWNPDHLDKNWQIGTYVRHIRNMPKKVHNEYAEKMCQICKICISKNEHEASGYGTA